MKYRIAEVLLLSGLCLLTGSCRESCRENSPTPSSNKQKEVVVPVVCVYTMGKVSGELQQAMMDSLSNH